MKIYQYYEPREEGFDVLEEKTEDEILEDYWSWWSEKMIKKFGHGHELITRENCIQDWVTVYWAWEKKDESP